MSIDLTVAQPLSATPQFVKDQNNKESSLSLSTGNIGIGTTEPKARLNLPYSDGDYSYENGILIGVENNGLEIGHEAGGITESVIANRWDDDRASLNFKMRTSGTPVTAMAIKGSGNVGIRTTSDYYKLDILGHLRTSESINIESPGGNSNFEARPTGSGRRAIMGMFNDAGLEGRLVLTDGDNGDNIYFSARVSESNYMNAGNVGIGTVTPGRKLHVNNSSGGELAAFTTSAKADATIMFGNNISSGKNYTIGKDAQDRFRIRDTGDVDYLTIQNNGNVGIGTTSPGQKLVIGGINGANNADQNAIQWTDANNNQLGRITGRRGSDGNKGILKFEVGNAHIQAMTINETGYVGIGTTSPSEKLYVEGNIRATGSITPGSSRELKQDIQDLSTDEAIAALRDLKPTRFRYRADPDEENLGFIAEEVPDLVATNDRRGVSPMDIVAVLTKVVQEQQDQSKQQHVQLVWQQRKIEEFEARLNARQ